MRTTWPVSTEYTASRRASVPSSRSQPVVRLSAAAYTPPNTWHGSCACACATPLPRSHSFVAHASSPPASSSVTLLATSHRASADTASRATITSNICHDLTTRFVSVFTSRVSPVPAPTSTSRLPR